MVVPECVLTEVVVDGEVMELTKSQAAIQKVEKTISATKDLVREDIEKEGGSEDYEGKGKLA